MNDNTASISITVATQTVAGVNNGNGTWTLGANVLTTIADGTYDVAVSATDGAGNVGTDASTNELSIDTTAPTATVTPLETNDNTPVFPGAFMVRATGTAGP